MKEAFCKPPACWGGGLECEWNFSPHLAGPAAQMRFLRGTLTSDRILAAFVCEAGVVYKEPHLVFGGVVIVSEPVYDESVLAQFAAELESRGLLNVATQSVQVYRSIDVVQIREGSGEVGIGAQGFTGDLTGGATLEADLRDGLPLEDLQVFNEHIDMPIADAGGPYIVECVGTATVVSLTGENSRATRDGTLEYWWSTDVPGVRFDDPRSATPMLIVDTSCGCRKSLSVRLIVEEYPLSTTSVATVTITDTRPPVIACPADIVVECTTSEGVRKGDAAIHRWLTSVGATDECDHNVIVTNDAPDVMPFGASPVTFTARDASGNTTTCVANIRVVDTTPPDLAVSAAPRLIWPASHQLVPIRLDIVASDVCDLAPRIELTTVWSSESEDGRGDGRSLPDITEATLGTDDREFSLRAERSGNGQGRTYRMCYRATDASGNATEVCDSVIVPHDQRLEPAAAAEPAVGPLSCEVMSNPARKGGVRFQFVVPTECSVVLSIYDILGRRQAKLLGGMTFSGRHEIVWRPTLAGVYYCRLDAGGESLTKRFVAVP